MLATLSVIFGRRNCILFTLTTPTRQVLSGFRLLRQSSVIYVDWGGIPNFGYACFATDTSSDATASGYGPALTKRLGLAVVLLTGSD